MRLSRARTARFYRSAALLVGLFAPLAHAQRAQPSRQLPAPSRPSTPPRATPTPTTPAPVEKLDEKRLRIGHVQVDLALREVSVPGVINDVPVLEFIANTHGGYKAYESAIDADTNAINFNLGLILIGLDRDRAVAPRFHFDPIAPTGDPVDVWVTWKRAGVEHRVRAEELVYDSVAKRTLPRAAWVYTGSRFLPKSTSFLADVDGVLIGFVHTPAPLIENANPVPGAYGNAKLNPALGLTPGTVVTLSAKATGP